MKTEVLWHIEVTNPVTKETMRFLGQGKTVAEALSEGIKNASAPYRPSSDGRVLPSVGLGVVPPIAVRLPDGRLVCRKLEHFESEIPYGPIIAAQPATVVNKTLSLPNGLTANPR